MADMTLQERYDEVSKLSGLSEEIIRRVYKATRQSLAQSLKQGYRATLPGICTITPELKHKLAFDKDGTHHVNYIKLKAKPSSALESELERVQAFESTDTEEVDNGIQLNYVDPTMSGFGTSSSGIRTKQINALL